MARHIIKMIINGGRKHKSLIRENSMQDAKVDG
jgi:hypothetical protein